MAGRRVWEFTDGSPPYRHYAPRSMSPTIEKPGPADHAAPPAAGEARPMVIEELLPAFDALRADHHVIPGDVDTAYDAVRGADFMRAWRETPAVRLLFGARFLGEQAVALASRRPRPQLAEPDALRLADLPTRGDWVILAERPPLEIAFGVIGRFWAGETAWEEIDAGDFADFDRPGLAKIACNFSLRPYGADRTLVSYECRTRAADEAARRGFLRYWRPLSPFIGVVLRAQLRIVEDEARSRGARG